VVPYQFLKMELGCLIVLHQLRQREIAAAIQLPRLQTGAGGVHQGQTISNENRTDKNRAAVLAAAAFLEDCVVWDSDQVGGGC
jgi:hypothetical protein